MNVNDSIIDVKPMNDYILELVYQSGAKRFLDMKPYLDFGIFKKIHDPVRFAQVRISFDTIEWEGGIDLDPEFIYQKSITVEN